VAAGTTPSRGARANGAPFTVARRAIGASGRIAAARPGDALRMVTCARGNARRSPTVYVRLDVVVCRYERTIYPTPLAPSRTCAGRAMSRRQARQLALTEAKIARDAQTRRAAKRRRRLSLGGVLAAAIGVVALAIGLSSGGVSATAASGSRLAGAAFSARLFSGIPQHGTVLGSPRAPVRLVEFADLQCPYCDEYALQALPTLVRDYVRTGELSMRFENLSFIGPDSVAAGRVAAATARQNRLWNFVDLMYLNQGEENTGYVTTSYLRRLLDAVPGLDVPAALRASQSPLADAALTQANAYAAGAAIAATPSFLVGRTGGPLKQLQPSTLTPAPFVQAIDALLKRAP
jgi:protein-disulfide isomerase